MDLSKIGLELYNLLENKNGMLARYIVAYDHNMDNENLIRDIGSRIGIYIEDDEYSPVAFYEKLKSYLLWSRINDPSNTLTDQVINMTRSAYENYGGGQYENRLMELMTSC